MYILIDVGHVPRSVSKYFYLSGKDARFVIGTLAYTIPLTFAESLEVRIISIPLYIVAVAPAGKKAGIEGILHVIGAIGAIIIGSLYFFMMGLQGSYMYWVVLAMLIGATLYMKEKPVKNHTFWIECMFYYILLIGILIAGSPSIL
jgi:hypothetical protein